MNVSIYSPLGAAVHYFCGASDFLHSMDWRDSTVLHALDSVRLDRERKDNRNLSLLQKVKKGAVSGCAMFIKNIALLSILRRVTRGGAIRESHGVPWPLTVVCSPIAEEIIFRGMVENGLHRGCSLMSGSRVAAGALVFALAHFSRIGDNNLNAVITQVTVLGLFPTMSIVYYTTGGGLEGLAASTVAHAVNNGLCAWYYTNDHK